MDILFVCYANLCRSPLAERISRHAIAELPALRELRLSVSSAGTHAEPGVPMHPTAQAALVEAGIDAAGFTSRPLAPELIDRAGLVLAAARQQRAVCVTIAPAALRRTFTIRQFGYLARHVDPSRLRAVAPRRRLLTLVDEVLRVRGDVSPVPAEEEDLADPIDGTADDVRSCVVHIRASLSPVFALLA